MKGSLTNRSCAQVGTAKLRDLDIGWKGGKGAHARCVRAYGLISFCHSDGVRADSLSKPATYADSEYSEHLEGVQSDDEK